MKNPVAVLLSLALTGCGLSPGAVPNPNDAWNPLLPFEVRRAAWAAVNVASLTHEEKPRLVAYYVGPEDRMLAWLNTGSAPQQYRMGYFEFEGKFTYALFGGKGTSKTIETNRFYVTVAEDTWQNIVQQGYGPGMATIPFDETTDWERYWADKWDGKGPLPSPIESPRSGEETGPQRSNP